MLACPSHFFFFFFNDTATTEIYTLSLHDALPISSRNTTTHTATSRAMPRSSAWRPSSRSPPATWTAPRVMAGGGSSRSGEDTTEHPSQSKIVFPLLPFKKKKKKQVVNDSNSVRPQ